MALVGGEGKESALIHTQKLLLTQARSLGKAFSWVVFKALCLVLGMA